MNNNLISLAPGVMIEELGHELLVMIPGSQETFTLSGAAADAIQIIASGGQPVMDATVRNLLALNILHSSSGMSRRGLLKAGSIGALGTVAVMSMPTVAAASSPSVTVVQGMIEQGLVVTTYAPLGSVWQTDEVYDEEFNYLISGRLFYKGQQWDMTPYENSENDDGVTEIKWSTNLDPDSIAVDDSPFTLDFAVGSENFSARGTNAGRDN